MREHHMPARISHGFVCGVDHISATYIRDDIAERWREAMLASIDMIENCADAPKNHDSLPEMVKAHLQQALSAFKDAGQSEADHE